MAGGSARQVAVSLESGIGPQNPPCPACGEPLFGWATAPSGAPVRRCESCGLGVVGSAGSTAEAIEALEAQRAGSDAPRYRIANRASLQASLGASGWAALDSETRYLFTAEAVRRLVAERGQRVARIRWRPGPSVLLMWGTLLNSFTLGRNVALAWLGLARSRLAPRRWQRALDAFISIVIAPTVLLVAAPLEVGAAVAGRGGTLELVLLLE